MNKFFLIIFIGLGSMCFSHIAGAQTINMTVEIPKITSNPYHKPYVAIWLETPKREGVHTFAFWKEQPDWFKDLRQWWRKIGRKRSPNYDAVTGATRKPGVYHFIWHGQLVDGQRLPPGEYILHFESVREQGSREYIRQKIYYGQNRIQHYELQGKTELGKIVISVN